MTHKYLVVVPAREGSKRIRDKNLLSVGSRTLILRAADSVRESKIFRNGEVRLVCCTNSDRCRDLAISADMEVVDAPEWFAVTDRPLNHTLRFLHQKIGGDIVMMALADSPFRRGKAFDDVARILGASASASIAMTLIRNGYPPEHSMRMNGQGVYTYAEAEPPDPPEPSYRHDGQVWAIRADVLPQADDAFAINSSLGVEAVWPEWWNLNWPWEMEVAQWVAERQGL